jgi:DNA-directed RNA polymerase subunit RPC12/RpoP|tara:strand:+ start:620 stop:856 length:237 start_codon:yes stop_codon:yes gene_type:complete
MNGTDEELIEIYKDGGALGNFFTAFLMKMDRDYKCIHCSNEGAGSMLTARSEEGDFVALCMKCNKWHIILRDDEITEE